MTGDLEILRRQFRSLVNRPVPKLKLSVCETRQTVPSAGEDPNTLQIFKDGKAAFEGTVFTQPLQFN